MVENNNDGSIPITTAKDVLDFLVKKGVINYSSYDKTYFYWKNGDIFYLNFRLD